MFLKQQGVGWWEYSALVAFLQIFLVFLIIEARQEKSKILSLSLRVGLPSSSKILKI